MEEIITKLKDEARRSWDGEIGEKRATDLENYLRNKLKEYSEILDVPQEKILKSWESWRTYSAINYYQECNQPSLNGRKVKVFKSVSEMNKAIGKKEFRCPMCGGISTNPYKCNSGLKMNKTEICNWNVGGLFKDLGKGTYVFCKDKLIGETIFTPISWE